MTNSKLRILVLVCAALLFGPRVWASDPVGIYGVIERVVFEPDAAAPQRVQVWGAFALSDGRSGDSYLPPQRGYLYYTLTPGQEDICRKEWADLASVAGSGQAVGFGLRHDTQTRLRQSTEKTKHPDSYPIGVGVMKVGNGPRRPRQPALIEQIRKTLQSE
jgi:hypothetical protein